MHGLISYHQNNVVFFDRNTPGEVLVKFPNDTLSTWNWFLEVVGCKRYGPRSIEREIGSSTSECVAYMHHCSRGRPKIEQKNEDNIGKYNVIKLLHCISGIHGI